MKKILGSVMIAGLLFAGTACGGDDDSTSSDKTTAPADGGDTTDAPSGDGSDNQAVADYCKEAEELGKSLKEIMADPTKGDVAAVTAQAQELVAAAQELITANADDVDEITACSNKITEAMAG